jgi:hypothetical protein
VICQKSTPWEWLGESSAPSDAPASQCLSAGYETRALHYQNIFCQVSKNVVLLLSVGVPGVPKWSRSNSQLTSMYRGCQTELALKQDALLQNAASSRPKTVKVEISDEDDACARDFRRARTTGDEESALAET